MSDRDQQLLSILAIGHDASMRGSGLSLRDALRRARYRESREALHEADLLRLVRVHPALVDEWLAYSEDKRTNGGWYVLKSGEVGQVDAPGSKLMFAAIEEAIASYVVRELDFWAKQDGG
jgi:hypothetical protein